MIHIIIGCFLAMFSVCIGPAIIAYSWSKVKSEKGKEETKKYLKYLLFGFLSVLLSCAYSLLFYCGFQTNI